MAAMRTMEKMRFEIECGSNRFIVDADSPQAAWEAFKIKAQHDLSDLARFREIPWNSKYTWDRRFGGHRKTGQWYYVHPCWFATAGEMSDDLP